jgi:hypothetical protein
MTSINVYPFLRPSDDTLNVKWMINGIESPEFSEIPHWDPATSIKIQVNVSLDLQKIKEQCRLSDDDIIRISFSWFSPGTSLKECCKSVDASLDTRLFEDILEWNFSKEIEGGKVFESVQCYVCISLANCRENNEFQFCKQGTILLNKDIKINLDTLESRFPVEQIDFSNNLQLPAADAGWFLDWNPDDLSIMALGGIRLYINSHHQNIVKAVMMKEKTPANLAIIQTIKFEIARLLIFGALENEKFIEDPDDFDEGSIGAYIDRLISITFPNEDITALSNQTKDSKKRQDLECRLQEKLRLFQELI